jgi:D-alanyl-D-alanine carboxypeptidase
MRQTAVPRTATRRTLAPNAAGMVVVAAIFGALIHWPASSSAPSFSDAGSQRAPQAAPPTASSLPPSPGDVPRFDRGRGTTAEDGALPAGVTVFDDGHPGVANLDPDLLGALREAAMDAADEGIEFHVTSGWRSAEYQNRLLREAVSKYGSEREAARWVATADTSPHVSGDAVDIGPFDATSWMSEHGGEYGLCQIYRNEPWHYELRPEAIDRGCPRMFSDPSHDPRMQP